MDWQFHDADYGYTQLVASLDAVAMVKNPATSEDSKFGWADCLTSNYFPNPSGTADMKLVLSRAFLIWLLIIAAETVHGILRTAFLAPRMGDFAARQFAVFTGSLLIFLIAVLTVRWIRANTRGQWLIVGLMWVGLTVLFEIVLGKAILGLSWERIFEDYDVTRGGLLGFGLLIMLLSPLLAAKVRKIESVPA